jgi:uncharacterized protein (TIGR00251 family)
MGQTTERLLIQVKVRTRARQAGVERLGPRAFSVKVSAPPVKGEANRHVVKLLARHFDVPPSAVSIIKGRTSSQKIVAVTRSRS